jgi:hypothetical protein
VRLPIVVDGDLQGLQIEGILAYFTHLKCQKHIGDDVGDFKYVFTQTKKMVKMTP